MIRIKILFSAGSHKENRKRSGCFSRSLLGAVSGEVCVTAEGTALSARLCRVAVDPPGALADGACPAPEGFLTAEKK